MNAFQAYRSNSYHINDIINNENCNKSKAFNTRKNSTPFRTILFSRNKSNLKEMYCNYNCAG